MGAIRIVAGERRGHLLRVPPGGTVRPTSERLREAVFSALTSRLGSLSGLEVLDLFAGTGALGLEALSRGANRCSFVESDRRVAAVLLANIAALGYAERSQTYVCPYQQALQTVSARGLCYDVLFVDPPYRMVAEVVEDLARLLTALLNPAGLAVIEGPKDVYPQMDAPIVFQRRYGDTLVTMVGRKDGAACRRLCALAHMIL
jgi:16S rRNA (guanine966-N2)-methyltransferase